MTFDEKMNLWSEAHVFYNMFNHDPGSHSTKEVLGEHKWQLRMLNTPNGSLLTENSLFDNLKKSPKIYLVHITPNLNQILESGSIYSSGDRFFIYKYKKQKYGTQTRLIKGAWKPYPINKNLRDTQLVPNLDI